MIEKTTFTDSETGRTVIRWTNSPAKDQALYFTSHSVTADDRWLVFISERDGSPNLYAIERPEGTIHQLTHNTNGLLRSYVYPQGTTSGLSKAAPCIDEKRNRAYYIADDAVFRIDLDTRENRKLADLPAGWYTAFNHVSADGKTLCVPVTPPEVFPDNAVGQRDQMQYLKQKVMAGEVITQILRIDTETGESSLWAEIPFWVTHVNYDPSGADRITFNSESTGKDKNRIWCLESDGEWRALFEEGEDEWCNHENWSPTGEFITYHGAKQVDGKSFEHYMAARKWDGTLVYQYPLPEMTGSSHVTTRRDGRSFVTDGLGDYVSILTPDGDELKIEHACLHATEPTGRDQDAHAHPLEVPTGGSIVFTSDRDGVCNVYEVVL